MYSGQFETRRLPDAGAPSSGGADADGDSPPPESDPHAARNDGPRMAAVAAAAPPPTKRRREVRLVARRDRSRGSISLGIAGAPFVDSEEEWKGSNAESSLLLACASATSRRASPRGPLWWECRRREAPTTPRVPS